MESTAAKAKFHIGTTAAASSVSEFEADTYIEIKSIEDLGEIANSHNEIAINLLGEGRVRRRKGAFDAGIMEVIVARDPQDTGQNNLRSALPENGEYNFKVELDDKPEAAGTPTVFYFRAPVMSARTGIGQADNIVRDTFSLAINSDIFEVAAAPAP